MRSRRHNISIQGFLHRFGCTSDGRAVPAANPAHPHVFAAGATDQYQSTPEPRNRGPVGSRYPAPASIKKEGGVVMVISAERRANQAAKQPSLDPEDLPTYRAYHLEIPTSWRALGVVFYPGPDDCDGSDLPDSDDPLHQGFRRIAAGVLLCRQATDDQAAWREFEADDCPERAFLNPEGQFLQPSQSRPIYGVLGLAYSSPDRTGRSSRGACLVLMPLIGFPAVTGRSYTAPLLFVDGKEVA